MADGAARKMRRPVLTFPLAASPPKSAFRPAMNDGIRPKADMCVVPLERRLLNQGGGLERQLPARIPLISGICTDPSGFGRRIA